METNKTTLVLGATTNPSRYAYMAANQLVKTGHKIINVGIKTGEIAGVKIETASKIHQNIDTITLYIGSANQPQLYNYIIATQPKRIIFNPGTENPELETPAQQNGIETLEACTLVLLATKQY
ncbi:MAG: CoA-binding protein [Sphingobacteriales bacterium]|nr:MAG: CoA-binding protein [Sphingobacteriales bacterium]